MVAMHIFTARTQPLTRYVVEISDDHHAVLTTAPSSTGDWYAHWPTFAVELEAAIREARHG